VNKRAERMARRLGLVAQNERVLIAAAPSPLDIVLSVLGRLIALIVLAFLLTRLAPWAAGVFGPTLAVWISGVVGLVLIVAAALVFWSAVVWAFRVYLLTDRRAVWVSGVFRRLVVECELADVRQAVMFQPLRQRVFGLGTIGLATAGTDTYEVVWSAMVDPAAALALVRETTAAARRPGPQQNSQQHPQQHSPQQAMTKPSDQHNQSGPADHQTDPHALRIRGGNNGRLPVIGIVGGIGAGKSEVASVFASLGCAVADSDRQVRAALDEPEIIRTLESWWGPEVLHADGSVNRSGVAAIVFEDQEQRRRLESLLHPLVHAARVDVIRHAAENGARAVIVDAPLLFEAGVDRECDAVVFVDAPQELRAQRVRLARGWSEQELARREASQMPIDQKRALCRFAIVNDGDLDKIRPQAERVLAELESSV